MNETINVSMRRPSDFQSEDSNSSLMSDDESMWSFDRPHDCTGLEYRKKCAMLENQMKCNLTTKNFEEVEQGYCFACNDQAINVRVRVDSNGTYVEFSCDVHTIKVLENCENGSSYALMTTMMKYKTMLSESDSQDQLGRCGDKFIFLRRLPTLVLLKENFVDFSLEVDDFTMKAQKMKEGFASKSAAARLTQSALGRRLSRRKLIAKKI